MSADRLMTATFEDLLPELCDKEVRPSGGENPAWLRRARSGEVVDIVTGKAAKPKKPRR